MGYLQALNSPFGAKGHPSSFPFCYVLYKKLQNAVAAFVAISREPQQLALCNSAVSAGARAKARFVSYCRPPLTQLSSWEPQEGRWQSKVRAEEIQTTSSALTLEVAKCCLLWPSDLEYFAFNEKKATVQLLIPNVYISKTVECNSRICLLTSKWYSAKCGPAETNPLQVKIPTCIPTFRISLFHSLNPALIPGVSKVHKQHQLDKNEAEGSTNTNSKPS